tara:strand:- start:735 stop:1088 length:354 start_codon:yes stop_codon:yes gene_type:complete
VPIPIPTPARRTVDRSALSWPITRGESVLAASMRAHEERRVEALRRRVGTEFPEAPGDEKAKAQEEQEEEDDDVSSSTHEQEEDDEEELFFMDDVVQIQKEDVGEAPSASSWWVGWR